MADTLVEIDKLSKSFPVSTGIFEKKLELKAVQGVSLDIRKGETLGLVGESGCGKSTLGRCVLRLLDPDGGSVRFDGKDIFQLGATELKKYRRRMQIIFQDPYSSLNPRMTVGKILEEVFLIHNLYPSVSLRREQTEKLLTLVGLKPEDALRYPHEFSGGQRQRVGIARALAVEPEFIVCDEPVSALDVSIQAQILNLLIDLQSQLNLSYLFISHDLRVVEHMCHRVAVMYLGKLVEVGESREIYENAKHPYTQALLSAVPNVNPSEQKERIVLEGDLPRPSEPPSGCQFHPRCFMAKKECREKTPALKEIQGTSKHQVSCLMVE